MRMKAEIMLGQRKNYTEAEKVLEDDMERISIAMHKIQDIDKKGTAYTVTTGRNIESIFEYGLLGYDTKEDLLSGRGRDFGSENSKYNWVKFIRNRKSPLYFNIIGRSKHMSVLEINGRVVEMEKNKLEIDRDTWLNTEDDTVAILFDISHFKEKNYEKNFKHGFFYSSGETISDAHGFRLSDRDAPRFLKGIVLKKGRSEHYAIGSFIISKQIDKNYIVPIYDSEGNLLWPKQMSYEEVKKFVAEREAKKELKS
jgi:hypothetical protein